MAGALKAVTAAASLWVVFGFLINDAHAEPAGSIGYESVAEALQAVRADPSAQVHNQQGWILATQETAGQMVFWAFTPPAHPAHPAAVKRMPIKKSDGWHIQMAMLCGSTKQHCDQLFEEFKALNERMKQDIQRKTPSGQ